MRYSVSASMPWVVLENHGLTSTVQQVMDNVVKTMLSSTDTAARERLKWDAPIRIMRSDRSRIDSWLDLKFYFELFFEKLSFYTEISYFSSHFSIILLHDDFKITLLQDAGHNLSYSKLSRTVKQSARVRVWGCKWCLNNSQVAPDGC